MEGDPHEEDGEPPNVLHGGAEDERAESVHHSEANHHVTDRVDAQSARDVGLEKNEVRASVH